MGKNHLKRLFAPKTWPIQRRATKFVSRPMPGRHCLDMCIPLNLLLKEILGVVKTTKESKYLIKESGVLIDGIVCHDEKYPVGLMDVISLPLHGLTFRVIMDKKGMLKTVSVDAKQAQEKVCKIIKKVAITSGKIQLTLHDSTTMILEKSEHKVADSVRCTLPHHKVAAHLALKKGAHVLLYRGRHAGEIGVVDELDAANILVTTPKGAMRTLRAYAFVIGNEEVAQFK